MIAIERIVCNKKQPVEADSRSFATLTVPTLVKVETIIVMVYIYFGSKFFVSILSCRSDLSLPLPLPVPLMLANKLFIVAGKGLLK